MVFNNRFLQKLGVQHPIIQAPMAGISTPALAAAVSHAGALGSIAVGSSTAKQARELIAATRALTNKPFLTSMPAVCLASDERVSEAIDEDPALRFHGRALDGEYGDHTRALVLLDVSAQNPCRCV